jgi:hypothetical protein
MKNKIESIKKKIMNVPLFGHEIVDILQSEFEDLGVEVTLNKVDEFPENEVTVNGYFNSFDWDLHENIELVIIVSDDEGPITINSSSWEFMRHQMVQTLEHEIIHRDQMAKRHGYSVLPAYLEGMSEEQKRIVYLSDPDEIDAYANDIVLDLLSTLNKTGACLVLENYAHATVQHSPILFEYNSLFGPESKVVKTIVKKAFKKLTN